MNVQLGDGRTFSTRFICDHASGTGGDAAPIAAAPVGHILQRGPGHLIDGVDHKPIDQQHKNDTGGDHSDQNSDQGHLQELHPVVHHIVHGDINVHQSVTLSGFVPHPDHGRTEPAVALRVADIHHLIVFLGDGLHDRVHMPKFHFRVSVHNGSRFRSPVIQDVDTVYVVSLLNLPKDVQLIVIFLVLIQSLNVVLDLLRIYHIRCCVCQIYGQIHIVLVHRIGVEPIGQKDRSHTDHQSHKNDAHHSFCF